MKQRDTFLPKEYWTREVQSRGEWISKHEMTVTAPSTSHEHRVALRYSIFSEHLELLIARYSQGEELGALRRAFPAVIDALNAYHDEPGHRAFDFHTIYAYVDALWLVSLAILLVIDQDDLERLIALIGNDGHDALYDRLTALCIPRCLATTKLLHPRPYEFLYSALDTHGNDRDQMITRFLKGYYRGMRRTHWHDRHLYPTTGFFGYWCFELAAFVKALRIPDQSFADNIYYPRDLVTWSESCRTSSS